MYIFSVAESCSGGPGVLGGVFVYFFCESEVTWSSSTITSAGTKTTTSPSVSSLPSTWILFRALKYETLTFSWSLIQSLARYGLSRPEKQEGKDDLRDEEPKGQHRLLLSLQQSCR
ncbi:hypothetical protein JOB18_003058 [Solea senegalensis]|uniref:Uncharacterized protein n=1 Tax=Solea senegalensis TaxID=28829 RepID=A0AAV6RGV1_SOLSE|nr:hypothetical protein JOB18_003058 [Solea senegalensis]